MPVIPSVPAGWTNASQTVTFAIPAGVWSAASYSIGNGAGRTGPNVTGGAFQTSPSNTQHIFAPTTGNWSSTGSVAAGQLTDINLAAGHNLSVLVFADSSFTVGSFTLTLTGSAGGGPHAPRKNRAEVTSTIYIIPGIGISEL